MLARVTRSWPVAQNAILPGYRRLAFKHESYPGIVPASKRESVSGILFLDLNGFAWQYLDAFEGDIYERLAVSVIVNSTKPVSTQTYVVREDYRYLLAKHDWDFKTFLEQDLSAYLAED